MKTFKDKNPLHKPLNKNVLNIFLENQERYTTILQDAQKVSLKKTRIKISIATWIRISLGDTLRFIINHQVRHLEQADKVLKK